MPSSLIRGVAGLVKDQDRAIRRAHVRSLPKSEAGFLRSGRRVVACWCAAAPILGNLRPRAAFVARGDLCRCMLATSLLPPLSGRSWRP